MQQRTRLRARAQPSRLRSARIASAALVLVMLPITALIGCGSSTTADHDSALQLAPPQCADATARGLGEVGEHIYHEIAGGRIAQPAVDRVASSPALLAAAQADDPVAARAALKSLLRNQLVRLRVTVAGHTFLEYGNAANAVAPVSAPLKNAAGRTIGTVVASEQGAREYADTVHSVSGAQVFVRSGSRPLGGSTRPAPRDLPSNGEISYRGTRYAVYSFPGRGFPAVSLRTFVLTPVPPASACAATAAETATATVAASAEKIYRDEKSGGEARSVVRDFERSGPFQEAVADDNRAATEAAIVTFFKSTLHVVRVRATLGEKLVADVGGPHVLAPTGGKVHDARGRLVGHFLLSVQDDLGYVILAHRFTGAQVFLRQGSQQIMSSIGPGPPSIPGRGEVVYHGIHYQAYSFLAEAFPSGPLRVSLLIPPVPGT